MKLPVTIYQDEEGWYVVECPVIPGCMSQGSTEEEALQNIQEAIQLCLEVRQEKGLPLTIHSLEFDSQSGVGRRGVYGAIVSWQPDLTF